MEKQGYSHNKESKIKGGEQMAKQIKGKSDKYHIRHGGDAHHTGQNAKHENESKPVKGFSQAPHGMQ